MAITSVSGAANSAYVSNGSSDEITQLDKEKSNLQKELKEVNQSKEDAKTKQQKVQKLQNQIQQIDAQIQQLKAEKTASKQNVGRQLPEQDNNKSSRLEKSDADKLLEQVKKSLLGSQIDVQV